MSRKYLGRNYDKNFIRKVKKKKGEKYYTKEDLFISRMASIIKKPHKVTHELFSQRAITSIRLNNLAGDSSAIKYKLERKGLNLVEVPWAKDAYILPDIDKSDLGKTHEYKSGLFYIQNLSSLLPALSLDWENRELTAKKAKKLRVLDMCASPGGKTLQITSMAKSHYSDLFPDETEITANEVDFYRYKKMLDVFRIFHGTEYIDTQNLDGVLYAQRRPSYYDVVFLDAPCSGEGQVYLDGAKPLRSWSIKKMKFMVALQKELIRSAFLSLKKGGYLIYSTCTLEPDENEGIISYLKKQYKNSVSIEPISLVRSPEFADYRKLTSSGLVEWSGNTYHADVKNAVRVIPGEKMMGFFVAKILKK